MENTLQVRDSVLLCFVFSRFSHSSLCLQSAGHPFSTPRYHLLYLAPSITRDSPSTRLGDAELLRGQPPLGGVCAPHLGATFLSPAVELGVREVQAPAVCPHPSHNMGMEPTVTGEEMHTTGFHTGLSPVSRWPRHPHCPVQKARHGKDPVGLSCG